MLKKLRSNHNDTIEFHCLNNLNNSKIKFQKILKFIQKYTIQNLYISLKN